MMDPYFSGGRLITTDEGERQREIERLKRKYADVIEKYAEFRAEYPYTTRKAREILARQARYKGKRSSDPNDDIIYPELSDLSQMSPVQASDTLVRAAAKTVANNRRRITPTLIAPTTATKTKRVAPTNVRRITPALISPTTTTSPDTAAVFSRAYDEGKKLSKRDEKLLRGIEKTRNMSLEELDDMGMEELHKFLGKVKTKRAKGARVKGFFN